jgi:dihydrolipoamide dehydrogenase
MNKTKLTIIILLFAMVSLYISLDLGRFLTLDQVQAKLADLQQYKDENFLLAVLIYLLGYVFFIALSVPGALLLTLMGGAVFGLVWGTVLVSFASSIGATLAFLVSRSLLHDWVQAKFGDYLAPINRGMRKDGAFFLFSIRMVPLFPFFMVNLLMGLTPISITAFYVASQAGMFLSTIIFVNAGAELAQISNLSDLVSTPLLVSFALLGVLPLAAKYITDSINRNRILRRFRKPAHFDANVVVIGAGSAGLVTSLIVAGAKARVILIEKHRMGGDCLNTGCVPSKSLIRSARTMALFRRSAEFGLDNVTATVNFPAVMQRVQGIIKTIEPHDSVERFTSLGVECVSGEAKIVSPYCVEVNGKTFNTRAIVIATGARPLVPPIPGLQSVDHLTSDSVWNITTLPVRLLIIGGGPIGCELAQAFNSLGSKVSVIDMESRILGREDEEVSSLVKQRFESEGIQVLCDHRVLEFRRNHTSQIMMAEHNGESLQIEFDYVLLALGRRANVEGFGLEELDMPLTEQGTIEVNEYLQTAYPNIYACGDVTGPYQFTHMASFQAWYAALNAMVGEFKKSRVNYRVVPWATFIEPEVARVGLNELEAKQKNINYELTRYELAHLDRAVTDDEAYGFIKILTVPGKDKILGVTIVGSHAGDLITEFVFAMTHNLGLKKIAAVTHIYPTYMEANKFAANAWRKSRLPVKYFPMLERFFRWRRGD